MFIQLAGEVLSWVKTLASRVASSFRLCTLTPAHIYARYTPGTHIQLGGQVEGNQNFEQVYLEPFELPHSRYALYEMHLLLLIQPTISLLKTLCSSLSITVRKQNSLQGLMEEFREV